MIALTGTNLNKRHQELNTKVNDAAKCKVDFEKIKDKTETSDVDKLFKIDLAWKYKNIDYILEILKSGDSLYISRALKCDLIVDDEFAQLIQPQYLERNIFPFMAPKMKKKVLATISSRLRNGERAEEFHHYCMRNKMINLGMIFLLYTNETFKIEILKLHSQDFNRNEKYLEHFIGNSFLLLEHYLEVSHLSRSRVLYILRYLYSVSPEKYLDLLETCTEEYNLQHTSLKLSRDIMKKHKKRVLKNPWLYLHILDQEVVVKYSTSDDAKVYAVSYLPDSSYSFWCRNYCEYTNFFLKLIPFWERFSFIKKIFTEKYPGEMFEESYTFYTYAYYEMMTEQEREIWALNHIASEKEIHGRGNDYIWYRFVNFQLALAEIKKYILITPDNDKRSQIIQILVESAKTEEELTTLIDYYYNRHVNELKEYKRIFIYKIIEKHNIFIVGDKCWTSLEKILYSLDVYSNLSEDYYDYLNNELRALAFIYYIIHEIDVPKVLKGLLISGAFKITQFGSRFNHHMNSTYFEMIYQYVLPCLAAHVTSLIHDGMESLTNQNRDELSRLINEILDLIQDFNKSIEEIPNVIRDFIMQNFELFENHPFFYKPDNYTPPRQITPPPTLHIRDIMHYLKEDSSLVVSNFSVIKEYYGKKNKNINWLIRKLRIYFFHDLAPEYVKLLSECFSEDELYLHAARVAVYGILNLSNEKYKIDFVKKYVPVDAKIDHANISQNLLTIQKAICSVACHTRPHLPLACIREYIKGDYLQYCTSLFDSNMANLMPAQFLCFVESLVDSPVSIQKHGLRMAFHCFSTKNLRNLVLNAWKKTKNVSLRKIIYMALFDKVNYYHDNLPAQWELFGALNIKTHNLNNDDDEELFRLLHRSLPPNVLGQHLQSAYIVLNTFPRKRFNNQRLAEIIRVMEHNIELISKNILHVIIEDHIISELDDEKMLKSNYRYGKSDLTRAKWSLVENVIIKHNNLDVIHLIMIKVLTQWYKQNDSRYEYRLYFTGLINRLEELSFHGPIENYLNNNNIFHAILTEMEKVLPNIEIYLIVWRLKLNILRRQVLGENLSNVNETDRDITKTLVNQTMLKFCHKVKDLMKEYLENGKYFLLFCQDIMEIVRDVTTKARSTLNRFVYHSIDPSEIEVLLCLVLSECKESVIQKFVVNYIPQHYNGEYYTEYLDIIRELKSVDDENKYFLWHRFQSSV